MQNKLSYNATITVNAESFVIEIAPQEIEEFRLIARKLPPGVKVSIAYHSKISIEEHVAVAREINMLGFRPWPHIAARHLHSITKLENFVAALTIEANVDSCVIIAGHIPYAKGPFNDSLDLINSRVLKKYGIKEVAIAGHPSGHLNLSITHLNEICIKKINAIIQGGMKPSIITQYELETASTLRWLESLRLQGIDVPVYIGMLGPADVSVFSNIVKHCDFNPSLELQEKYGLFSKQRTFITPEILMSDYYQTLTKTIHGQVFFHIAYGKLTDITTWIDSWLHSMTDMSFATN